MKKMLILVLAGALLSVNSSQLNATFGLSDVSKMGTAAVKVGTKALTVSIKIAASQEAVKANQEAALEILDSLPEEYHETIAQALMLLNDSIKAGLVPVTGVVSIVESISQNIIAPVSQDNANKLQTKLIDPIKGQLVILKNTLKSVADDLTMTPEQRAKAAADLEAAVEKAETEPAKEDTVDKTKPIVTKTTIVEAAPTSVSAAAGIAKGKKK